MQDNVQHPSKICDRLLYIESPYAQTLEYEEALHSQELHVSQKRCTKFPRRLHVTMNLKGDLKTFSVACFMNRCGALALTIRFEVLPFVPNA